MDEKTRDENEALKEMFQSAGWQVLMRNTQHNLDTFREGFPFNVIRWSNCTSSAA